MRTGKIGSLTFFPKGELFNWQERSPVPDVVAVLTSSSFSYAIFPNSMSDSPELVLIIASTSMMSTLTPVWHHHHFTLVQPTALEALLALAYLACFDSSLSATLNSWPGLVTSVHSVAFLLAVKREENVRHGTSNKF